MEISTQTEENVTVPQKVPNRFKNEENVFKCKWVPIRAPLNRECLRMTCNESGLCSTHLAP